MPTQQSLKFKDKLLVKSQSGDALLKKVKALHAELSMMDQENVNTKSLATVSRDLIDKSILLHRDRGVKAYAACCMADLLRLFAPDAPYTAVELKDMFQFFFHQIATGIKAADSPWFNEYVYLLESMATIKTVCLVPDLPHGDELTSKIFRDFFDMVKLELPKKVELFMSDILVALIEESPGLPSGVLEILLEQFTAKNSRMDQPTHRLAVDVCKATSDKLQGPVAQYFTDIIVEQDDDDVEDDVKEAHALIIHLNKSCPALLNNVVPQLGEELQVDNVPLRKLATETLGVMFAETGGVSLSQKYPQTWKQWMTRSRDKSVVVRVSFVEALRNLLMQHNSLSVEVEHALESKLFDADEKVRAATCKVYTHIDYETALHHVSIEQLKRLADRMIDRKSTVRSEAFHAIGRLYRLAYAEIEANDPAAVEHFAWIPGQVIHAASTGVDGEARYGAESCLSKYILPLPAKGDDEVGWTEQLLVTMRHLDPIRANALLTLTNIGLGRPTVMERYVQACIAYNGGVIDENEEKITAEYNNCINHLSRRFPDHLKASDDLQAFGKMHESRLYKFITTCLDVSVDLKTLVKSMNDLSRKLESSVSVQRTIMDLLRKHCLHIVNQSSIPTLVKRIQRHENDAVGAAAAKKVLLAIAKQCPAIFKVHVAEFSRALAEESNTNLIEVSLRALASVSRWDPSCAPNDQRTLDRVTRFARSDNRVYAKFATRLLAYTKKKTELCNALSKDIAKALDVEDNTHLEARLCVVAELAKSARDSFEESSDEFVPFLIRDVLTMAPDEVDEEEEWAEDEEVPYEARLKIRAIKACVNRCISHASLSSAEDVFQPVMKLLFAILNNMGTTKPDFADHAQVKARLRLQAANSLLKLSTIPKYSNLIVLHFPQLALVIQDQSYQVRSGFVHKLLSYLQPPQLDPRYHCVLFMTALDPEEEVRIKAQNFVRTAMAKMAPALRLKYFEMTLPRLLHLIAVHPDFKVDQEGLKDSSDYLDLYMDSVLTSENIHLLTFLAQKCKSVRVAVSHGLSENLYVVSELAQHKIRVRAVRHGWATNAYPGQVTLPRDIFGALPSAEVATKIQRTVYLSEEKIKWLDDQIKAAPKPVKPRKPRAVPSTRKRRSPNGKTNRRSKKRRKDDSDDESSTDGELSDDAIEVDSGDEKARAIRSSSAPTVRDEDIEMENSDEETERPRRNASRAARPRATKKKRAS